jgi:hypothetical protein
MSAINELADEPPPLDFAQWEREQRSFLARSIGTKAGIAHSRIRQHVQRIEQEQEMRFLVHLASSRRTRS